MEASPKDTDKLTNEVAGSRNGFSAEPKRPVWEVIVEIGAQIPDQEWAKVPSDASVNYKHYLYGAPKKDA